jgi:Phosphofructokinase
MTTDANPTPSDGGAMQHIAVVTSGGDAPGMNAAVRAVTRCALDHDWDALDVRHGYVGLIDGHFTALNARSVGGIIQQGGTVLGSTRCPSSPRLRVAPRRSPSFNTTASMVLLSSEITDRRRAPQHSRRWASPLLAWRLRLTTTWLAATRPSASIRHSISPWRRSIGSRRRRPHGLPRRGDGAQLWLLGIDGPYRGRCRGQAETPQPRSDQARGCSGGLRRFTRTCRVQRR